MDFQPMRIATGNWLQRLGGRSVDLLFPPTCLHCMAELDHGQAGGALCSTCFGELQLSTSLVCRRCGARVPEHTEAVDTCPRCEADKLRFDATLALGPYNGLLRDLVLRMKNDRSEQIGRFFANLMLDRWKQELQQMRVDAVLPIPTTRLRKLARGTNPPEVISRQIASRMGWEHFPHCLKCRRNSLPQHGLSRPGRFRNIRGRLHVARGYYLESPHILLVDDVLTTGATCSEAARILKRQGAVRVTVLAVGRTFDN